jgi:hypothetical protein
MSERKEGHYPGPQERVFEAIEGRGRRRSSLEKRKKVNSAKKTEVKMLPSHQNTEPWY